jgi:cytosine/adenosine deaminases
MNEYKYMLLAIEEAKKAYYKDEVPVGAVIVQNGEIISSAHNVKEEHQCSLEHAELIAIKNACKRNNNWRLTDSVIYITLEPCPMCASAIKQSRINKIVYLLDNNNENSRRIVNDILNSKDANMPVEKVKLDISKFEIDDVEMLSHFFKNKRY